LSSCVLKLQKEGRKRRAKSDNETGRKYAGRFQSTKEKKDVTGASGKGADSSLQGLGKKGGFIFFSIAKKRGGGGGGKKGGVGLRMWTWVRIFIWGKERKVIMNGARLGK